MSKTVTVTVVPGSDCGLEEIDAETAQLLEHLRDADVGSLRRKEIPAPAGSKAGIGLDPTTIFVTLAASGGVLTTFISAIQAWLGPRKNTLTVEIGGDKLTLTGATDTATRAIVKNWVERHG